MKASVIVLTKREQRVVIIIMIALIAGALASRYRNVHPPIPSTKNAPVSATAAPVQSAYDDNGNGD